ncbi:hypothetical protein EB796_019363 [Bugula neritina]|uniref:Uncharacterized protein n=1 Tax=Bugula neritina TaxID=10212 RepID=A0A7J7J9K7_BUGNE|nr:hypothetical protein EB796_019363 [Bugula neritina]
MYSCYYLMFIVIVIVEAEVLNVVNTFITYVQFCFKTLVPVQGLMRPACEQHLMLFSYHVLFWVESWHEIVRC